MSTIGHPLADLCNLLTPYTTSSSKLAMDTLSQQGGAGAASSSFQPGITPGLPTRSQCVEWYGEVSGWTPSKMDLAWGDAFSLYKLCVIIQGIAARYASRNASSAKAKEQGEKMGPMGEVTWELVQRCMAEAERARI
jgi:aminoglycoside phosphotransferase (APT) family kinase protein